MAYEIDININGDMSELETQDTLPSSSQKDETSKASKGVKQLSKYIASQTITPIISNVKSMVSQNIGIVTGNKELQQRVNFGLQLVETSTSLYSTAQAGAVITASMGLGAGLGLGIGALVGIANIGLQVYFNQQQINLQERMDNYQIEQIRQRQGMIFNRSR